MPTKDKEKPVIFHFSQEVFVVFDRAKEKIDLEKLLEYAFRFKTTTLLQRLGFLIDFLKIPLSDNLRHKLLSKIRKAQPIPLATPERFGHKWKLWLEWKIIQNVPKNLLH